MSEGINKTERPPVIAILGHVDHGKSTLLDYIRKSNVVEGEAGGITQHLSAYEANVLNAEGAEKRITFIDTPGHAAFSMMRTRGASIADIAILIVSAVDSVKAQTEEAISVIKKSGVPYMVAINMIDKAGANIEKVKTDLMSHSVYLEGYGGDIPYVEISAKNGDGVDELLETILLVAELEDFKGNPDMPAEGFVVESDCDVKRGNSAVVIIKDGLIKKGDFVVAGKGIASTRIFENFLGESISEATFSSPVKIVGFDILPAAGSMFMVAENKKEAEKLVKDAALTVSGDESAITQVSDEETRTVIPIIIKADVVGTKEAIEEIVKTMTTERVVAKIIKSEVGIVNESDIKLAATNEKSIIVGFNVEMDKLAKEQNEADFVTFRNFTVIYELDKWLREEIEKRREKKKVRELIGEMKVLKIFSKGKDGYLLGGELLSGKLEVKDKVVLLRNDLPVGEGSILTMQQAKSPVSKVIEGEFGMMVRLSVEPEEKDRIAVYIEKLE